MEVEKTKDRYSMDAVYSLESESEFVFVLKLLQTQTKWKSSSLKFISL